MSDLLESNWAKVAEGRCWVEGSPLKDSGDGWLRCPSCAHSFRTLPDGRFERAPVPVEARGKVGGTGKECWWVLATGDVVAAFDDTIPTLAVEWESRYPPV